MIDNIEAVIYTLNYVIPGYIILKIISTIIPTKKQSETEIIVQSIGFSILNNSIWSFAFSFVKYSFYKTNIVLFNFFTSLIFILSGVVTGTVIALLKKYNVLGKMLNILKIETTCPIPTAWDYVFSKYESYWVEIEVSSGKQIRGLFSNMSYASSEYDNRDIYLEKLYEKKSDNSVWEKVERTKGVWISSSDIKHIKFYELEEDE
ncbi:MULTISPECIES: DUF6338 family protein [Holdemanella]|jgi:hypothetical protein|uniref:DUF6338 family protein n=1 Tax=Holdemanella porci TaxID=2652276 RepID=UPI003AB49ABF